MKIKYTYDLHIHSIESKEKEDSDIVKNSDVKDLPVLLEALKNNKIDIFSITDHNSINLELYKKIKETNLNSYNLTNFFVGVELDVNFSLKNDKKTHVLIYFDIDKNALIDELENKINLINEIIKEYISSTDSNKNKIAVINQKMTFENYVEFIWKLQKNKIKFLTIATQKQDPNNHSHNNNSLSGNVKNNSEFSHFYASKYFSGVEVTNSKVKKMVELFLDENNLAKKGLISGSDCHDWKVYPKHDNLDNNIKTNKFFIAKTNPTFMGLRLIFSFPETRIEFSNKENSNFVNDVRLKFNQNNIDLFFFNGLNIIFGENGIGKTTIIKKISHELKKRASDGKSKNRINNGRKIELKNLNLKKEDISIVHRFFEQNKEISKKENIIPQIKKGTTLRDDNYIKEYFNSILKCILEIIKTKIDYHDSYNELSSSIIENNVHKLNDSNTFYPILSMILDSTKNHELKKLNSISNFEEILNKTLKNNQLYNHEFIINKFDNDINSQIEIIKNEVNKLIIKIEDIKKYEENKKKIILNLNIIGKEYSEELNKKLNSEDLIEKDFRNSLSNSANNIYKLLNLDIKNKKLNNQLNNLKLEFTFQPKNEIFKIDSKIILRRDFCYKNHSFEELYNKMEEKIFSYTDKKKWHEIETLEDFSHICRNARQDSKIDDLVEQIDKNFIDFAKEILEEFYEITNDGNENNMRNIDKISPGESALLFSTLIFSEKNSEGTNVYLIDQPEDEISGNKITNNLIPTLIKQSKDKQIIAVTHNPNIMINSDPDNLIYIFEEDGELKITSGTIDDTEMINIIAEKVEGGRDAIEKRMELYDKN